MSVLSNNIGIYYSGAEEFEDVQNNSLKSLGGYRSSVKVFNGKEDNLFDEIGLYEINKGVEQYRCIFFKNESIDENISNLTLWISGKKTFEKIKFGISQANLDSDPVQKLSSQEEIPYNVDFYEAYTENEKIQIAQTLEKGKSIAIWFCREIQPTEERKIKDVLLFNFDWDDAI